MKIRTHCNMARFAMNEIEKRLDSYKLTLYTKVMFYIGTMEPDFSIKQFIDHDFCCYIHKTGDVGNLQEHLVYERKINRYLLKKRKEIHKRKRYVQNVYS